MQKIKQVNFVLENCEVIGIGSEYIKHLFLGDTYDIVADKKFLHKHFTIEIFKEANILYKPFEVFDEEHVFKRLTKFKDIVTIEVFYTNESYEIHDVEWDDSSYTTNSLQQSYVNPVSENLHICIQ